MTNELMIVEPQWEIMPESASRHASDLEVIEAELLPL
jgi:hypothetical protein